MNGARILYLVSEDWYFCSHRLPIARAARRSGFEVCVLTRLNQHIEPILREGFRPLPLRIRRGSRSLLDSGATILDIARTYRRERPDLVHHVNLKMCLLGTIAALLAGVPRVVNALTGMGYLFTADTLDARILRGLVIRLLRLLMRWNTAHLIVQNRDDLRMVLAHRLADAERTVLIPGSGVDLRRFTPRMEPAGTPIVTFVGRMLRDKGVHEVVEAARILKQRGHAVRFALVGPTDPENPRSLTERELNAWLAAGLIEWWGYRSDIASVWADSTIAVLPSYREGLPKSLLEAAACGLPIVATDVPGCRDLIGHGNDGLLVPPRDATALADAVEKLLHSPALRLTLGNNARARAVREFSEEIVAEQTLRLYERLLGGQETRTIHPEGVAG
jgi:glycosyltransferase involved in cell wall biosynthesis